MAARVRSGGGVMAYAVGLVIFVILFVACLIAAILLYTQVNKAQVAMKDATSETDKLIRRPEREIPEIRQLLDNARKESVVGALHRENHALKLLIHSDANISAEDLRKLKEDAGVASGVTFLGDLKRLMAERKSAEDRIKTLEKNLDEASKRAKEIEESKSARDQSYKNTEGALNSKLNALTEAQTAYEQTVVAEQKKLNDRIQELQGQIKKAQDELAAKVAQYEEEKLRLTKRIEDLTPTRKGGVEVPDPTLLADGNIMAVDSDQNLVYINRGRTDHIPLGITFAVYDRNAQIDKDKYGELQGKATIEVVSVSDQSSTARVIRLDRGKTINEGDVIANVAYDPKQVYRFFLFGNFDIDITGQTTPADRRRIETLVSGWGARVVDKLSPQVDFLVVGEEPAAPQALPPGTIDPVLIAQNAEQQRIYMEYQRVLSEARSLKIPILNQNRLLALVGYYKR